MKENPNISDVTVGSLYERTCQRLRSLRSTSAFVLATGLSLASCDTNKDQMAAASSAQGIPAPSAMPSADKEPESPQTEKDIYPCYREFHYQDDPNILPLVDENTVAMTTEHGSYHVSVKNGKPLYAGVYDRVGPFCEGKAVVMKDGHRYEVNAEGKVLKTIQVWHSQLFNYCDYPEHPTSSQSKKHKKDFERRLERLDRFERKRKSTEGFMKKFGYESMAFDETFDGIDWAKKDGKEFHIDENGKPLYEKRFDKVYEFQDGIALAIEGDYFFYIKMDGSLASLKYEVKKFEGKNFKLIGRKIYLECPPESVAKSN